MNAASAQISSHHTTGPFEGGCASKIVGNTTFLAMCVDELRSASEEAKLQRGVRCWNTPKPTHLLLHTKTHNSFLESLD